MTQVFPMTRELLEAHAAAMQDAREAHINTLVEKINEGIEANLDSGVFRLDVTRNDHSVMGDVARTFTQASPFYRVRLHYTENYITVRWDLKYGPAEDDDLDDEDGGLDDEDE